MRRFGTSIMFRRGDIIFGGPMEGGDPTKARPYLVLSDPWVSPMDYANTVKLVSLSTQKGNMLDIPVVYSVGPGSRDIPISFVKVSSILSARYCDTTTFNYCGCIDPTVIDLCTTIEIAQISGSKDLYESAYNSIQDYRSKFIEYYSLPEDIFNMEPTPVSGTVTMGNMVYEIHNDGHLAASPYESHIAVPTVVTAIAEKPKEPPCLVNKENGKKVFINTTPSPMVRRSNKVAPAAEPVIEEPEVTRYEELVHEKAKIFESFQNVPRMSSDWTDEQLIDFMTTIQRINDRKSYDIYRIRYGSHTAMNSYVKSRWKSVAQTMRERGLESLIVEMKLLRSSKNN